MLTVNTLLDGLVDDYRINGRKSVETLGHHLKPLREAFGPNGPKSVNYSRLMAYVKQRQAEGRSPATINREMAALRRAYRLALTHELISTVPKFPMLAERNIRQGVFTAEEIDRLCDYLPKHLQGVVRFGYLTGRRRGEILGLTWGDVDFQSGVITIRASTTKTGQPSRLPMAGSLHTLMAGLYPWSSEVPGNPEAPVFQYHGRSLATFNTAWRRATKKAGLEGRLFHDLRRSVATDLVEAGIPEQVAMAITGHKTRSIFQRYNIVKQETVKTALESLVDYRGTSNK